MFDFDHFLHLVGQLASQEFPKVKSANVSQLARKVNFHGPVFGILVRFVPLVIDHNPGYKS